MKIPALKKIDVKGALRHANPAGILAGILRLWLKPEWIDHEANHFGEPGVYIANFSSWIDPLVFATLLAPELKDAEVPFRIAINQRHENKLVMKLCKLIAPVVLYDPAKSDAESTMQLAAEIAGGSTVLILPEARPTNTGAPLPVNDVLAGILASTNPTLHPFYLDGLSASPFSAIKPRQCRRIWRPKLGIHRFPSVHFVLPDGLRRRERTARASAQLYDLISVMAYAQYDYQRTLFESAIATAKRLGRGHIIVEDLERKPITYRKLLIGAYALGSVMKATLDEDEKVVGLLLPNAIGSLVTFMGLQAYGRTPAILNFTAGRASMVSACQTAQLQTVFTSKRFIKAAELEETVNAIIQSGVRVVYLEELRSKVTLSVKLKAMWLMLQGLRGYEKVNADEPSTFDADGAAVILFTSGSEGAPKGVVLSHANLMTNMAQLQSRLDFGANDVIFNPLPMFHTSGLTGGIILPLMSGMRMFLYPSPLHYGVIPELIADVDATVLFATDTFLAAYARHARSHDFHRLRYVFAGAEKLKEETRRLWADKFGVRIFEGYGVTETAPVLSFNSPTHCKPGTVGRLVPGINYRLEPVEGIEEGGRLVVQAGNVMAGYLLPENPGVLVPTQDGWHDTGDIVAIDAEGFVRILGRAKRFAKIAGEMVSLSAVEQAISHIWPEGTHAVVAMPDAKKGEQLLLITTEEGANRERIMVTFRELGLSEIYLPRQIQRVDSVPLLGSGKIDYPAVARLIPAATKEPSPHNEEGTV